MKAIQITEHGNSEVLKVSNINEPRCVDSKIKVRIKSSSVNHLDIWVRNGLKGLPIKLPLILGSDGAGTIVEIGKNINKFNIGDDVVIQPGTFNIECKEVLNGKENYSSSYGILGETENGVQAEYVNLNIENLYPKAAHLSFEEASSMQLVFMTSYQMLIKRANLKKEEYVLIYGATSGIGSAAIQIAKDIGAKIISTVGSKDKIRYAEDMGSDYVLIHNNDNNQFIKNVKEITNNNGCNVVFEHIGKSTWNQSLKILSRGGRLVTCGSTTGALVNIDLRHLFMKQQSILGSTMASIETFEIVMKKINEKKYKPFVDEIFTFDEIKNAHKYIENRYNKGKVILIPK